MDALNSADSMEKTCCPQCGGVVENGQCTQCGRFCRDEELVDWDTACYIAGKQEQKNRPKPSCRNAIIIIGKTFIGFPVGTFAATLVRSLFTNSKFDFFSNFIVCLMFVAVGVVICICGYAKKK